MQMSRRTILFGLAGTVAAAAAGGGVLLTAAPSARAAEVTVYKSPTCGCCGAWVEHLRESGFTVAVRNMDDLTPIKRQHQVPDALQGCHTGIVGGYVVEGHVPAADVFRLLAERPQARGLAVPGMPVGSPGMEQGDRREAYEVVLFGDRPATVWSRY